jgi:hypothetical protein
MQISVRASLEPGHNLAPPNPKKGNLVPASCHAHPVSIITTIKNLFTRRIIIIIIFKKKKEGKKKNCSQRNLDSTIIYSSCTIDLKLKLQ